MCTHCPALAAVGAVAETGADDGDLDTFAIHAVFRFICIFLRLDCLTVVLAIITADHKGART
jgi:hypothetical protein